MRRIAPRLGAATREEGLTCRACGAHLPCDRGVLVIREGREQPDIARERAAALATERDPALGGIDDSFDDLANAEGPLKEALLALPFGDGSRYYEEPGYFLNVRTSVEAFSFVLRHLQSAPGERLLDLGADLTWFTALLAGRGLECTAVDINHHLTTARLFERRYNVSYDLVEADMTAVPFRDSTFDLIIGINALHHSNDLQALAANIARMLAPGGRLGLVEPYCQAESDKDTFGRAQIAAGISEHVYTLDEWHRAFATAGLVAQTHRVADSFAAVYAKPPHGAAPTSGSRPCSDDLFDGFYGASLTVALEPPSQLQPDEVVEVKVRVENRGRHTWCANTRYMVALSYHLYRPGPGGESAETPGGKEAWELLSWDNPRTPLPTEMAPGAVTTITMPIKAPQARGNYLAEIDLVQEYVSWFATNGSEPLRIRFAVV